MARVRTIKRQRFVHLHAHSEFSFLDALPKVKGLGNIVKSRGFKSYAITDHGNVCGVHGFVKDLQGAGVKPIVGIEFYYVSDRYRKGLTDDERADGKERGEGARETEKRLGLRKNNHVVVIAKSNKGWRKIVRALEMGHREGFYYKPRIDMELLTDMAPDVVVTTACLGGVPCQLLLGKKWDEAVKWTNDMTDIFGDDFYLEIQPNEIDEQVKLNPMLVDLADETGTALVVTCDVHYVKPEHWETHDVMLAIRDSVHGKKVLVSDPDRFRYTTHELWMMGRQDVIDTFRRFHPDLSDNVIKKAVNTTLEIDEKIEPEILRERKGVLPHVKIEDKYDTPDAKLWALVKHGWKWRKINELTNEGEGIIDWLEGEPPKTEKLRKVYEKRVRHEMDIIIRLGFSKYFLVVYDLIWWARREGIRVGPGRGSVGGSIVAFLLGITSVDSIKYKCPFSRFVSFDRQGLPDIDCDFPTAERVRVKQYISEKYGPDFVASICTFGKLKGKAVLKDTAKVFGVDFMETNAVTQYVMERSDDDEGATDCLKDSVSESPELAKYASNYPSVIKHATQLEGNVRQIGVGAAGVLVSDEPLREMIPVQFKRKAGKAEAVVGEYMTGWEKRACEAMGLLKLDILGIEALTYIQRSLDLIHQRHGVRIEPEDWPELDDPLVYENFCEGNTELVWQMNTFGTIRVLKRLKPDRFKHLVATNALIRPGPQNSGITDIYIKRRHGKITRSIHPILDEILEPTYGLIVYQEDVIKVVHDVGGFTWAEADRIRKDVGKKKGVEYLRRTYVDRFIEGAEKHGIKRGKAGKIWNMISEFGSYGFNLAHSTAYSMLSYWTMWLKVHYPIEFMTAALESESKQDKRNLYIREAKRFGLRVIQPDVNVSGESYTIDPNTDNTIRAGLIDIKGVGDAAVSNIRENAPYTSFRDFVERCKANKTVVRALLQVGGFDNFEDCQDPWTVVEHLDAFLKIRKLVPKNRNKQWNSLEDLEDAGQWTNQQVEQFRLDLMGLPPEIHPATRMTRWLKVRADHYDIQKLGDYSELFEYNWSGHYHTFIVTVESVKFYNVGGSGGKNGDSEKKSFVRRVGRINIGDDTGQTTLKVLWPQVEALGVEALSTGQTLLVVARSDGYLKLSAGMVVNLANMKATLKSDGLENGTVPWWILNDPFEAYREAISESDSLKVMRTIKRTRRARVALCVLGAIPKQTKVGTIVFIVGHDTAGQIRNYACWANDIPLYGKHFKVGNLLSCCVRAKVKEGIDTRFSFVSNSWDHAPAIMPLERYLERYEGYEGE